ncbi:hypothetical protein COBT_000297 [Conglomerata obtusa]
MNNLLISPREKNNCQLKHRKETRNTVKKEKNYKQKRNKATINIDINKQNSSTELDNNNVKIDKISESTAVNDLISKKIKSCYKTKFYKNKKDESKLDKTFVKKKNGKISSPEIETKKIVYEKRNIIFNKLISNEKLNKEVKEKDAKKNEYMKNLESSKAENDYNDKIIKNSKSIRNCIENKIKVNNLINFDIDCNNDIQGLINFDIDYNNYIQGFLDENKEIIKQKINHAENFSLENKYKYINENFFINQNSFCRKNSIITNKSTNNINFDENITALNGQNMFDRNFDDFNMETIKKMRRKNIYDNYELKMINKNIDFYKYEKINYKKCTKPILNSEFDIYKQRFDNYEDLVVEQRYIDEIYNGYYELPEYNRAKETKYINNLFILEEINAIKNNANIENFFDYGLQNNIENKNHMSNINYNKNEYNKFAKNTFNRENYLNDYIIKKKELNLQTRHMIENDQYNFKLENNKNDIENIYKNHKENANLNYDTKFTRLNEYLMQDICHKKLIDDERKIKQRWTNDFNINRNIKSPNDIFKTNDLKIRTFTGQNNVKIFKIIDESPHMYSEAKKITINQKVNLDLRKTNLGYLNNDQNNKLQKINIQNNSISKLNNIIDKIELKINDSKINNSLCKIDVYKEIECNSFSQVNFKIEAKSQNTLFNRKKGNCMKQENTEKFQKSTERKRRRTSQLLSNIKDHDKIIENKLRSEKRRKKKNAVKFKEKINIYKDKIEKILEYTKNEVMLYYKIIKNMGTEIYHNFGNTFRKVKIKDKIMYKVNSRCFLEMDKNHFYQFLIIFVKHINLTIDSIEKDIKEIVERFKDEVFLYK